MGALDSERLEYPIQLTEDADLKLEQFFFKLFFSSSSWSASKCPPTRKSTAWIGSGNAGATWPGTKVCIGSTRLWALPSGSSSPFLESSSTSWSTNRTRWLHTHSWRYYACFLWSLYGNVFGNVAEIMARSQRRYRQYLFVDATISITVTIFGIVIAFLVC